jgi:hypothetical protein
VLGEHVEGTGAVQHRVLGTGGRRVDRRPAFEHLEAVGRHQHGARRLVQTMVGAADALDKAARPFGAPTLMTRSTSPQSMPRSSVEVATTAFRVPAAMAASTLRRRAASSEP